jgi:GNAT superfamily N-acetyltransferase
VVDEGEAAGQVADRVGEAGIDPRARVAATTLGGGAEGRLMIEAVTIRRGRPGDAPEIAELATELGYPSSAEEIVRRLLPLLGSAEQLVLVAANGSDRAVGWLHAAVRHQLLRDPDVQVVGLVVAAAHRGAGVGTRLLAAAERWAAETGAAEVRVRSNVARERAHRFYLREGYILAKTSRLFVKTLRACR